MGNESADLPSKETVPEKCELDNSCKKCNKSVVQGGVMCEVCISWFHYSCVGLKSQGPLLKNKQIHWFCSDCNSVGANLVEQIQAIYATQQALKAKIDALTTENKGIAMTREEITAIINENIEKTKPTLVAQVSEHLKNTVDSMIEEKTKNTETEIGKKIETDVQNKINISVTAEKENIRQYSEIVKKNIKIDNLQNDIEKAVNETLSSKSLPDDELVKEIVKEETAERERIKERQLNLIIYNLPESNEAVEDISKAKLLIRDRLDIYENVIITNVTRFGQRNNERNRLCRITLETMKIKKTILQRAPQLRRLPQDDPFCKVYIRPDLTPKQMETSKNLYAELIAIRTQYGDRRFKISRGEIIELPTEANPEPLSPFNRNTNTGSPILQLLPTQDHQTPTRNQVSPQH